MGGFLLLQLLPEMLFPAGKGRQHLHLPAGVLLQRVHVPLRVQVQQNVVHRPPLAEERLQRLQQLLVPFVEALQRRVATPED